ncbi:ABC transporter G family protein [Tieghemostelium lacteum]|uniref:ABC transporter G family protein n=1 Tax=Tieghemostelium lacteum TaxID=361077 RepID=A0A152A5H8_TIELA|nr:ABC transporter G family protein [Tieghemostelium lacteum]|eukprot:KYR01479.1 ABC transporter G family protein [Tieghemostelium lacteum]
MDKENFNDNNNAIELQPTQFSLQHLDDIPIDENGTNTSKPFVIDVKFKDLRDHIIEKTPNEKTGFYVEARNLNFYVTRKIQKKKSQDGKSKYEKVYLLRDMTFYMKPGRMVLLMGAPSSGKSVLLKVLANRLGKGATEGSLLFNRHPVDEATHQKDTIYVAQEDRHIALLTVKETLEFSARCNMGDKTSDEEISDRVDMILEQLGLSHTINTIIGNEFFRGISGGQKRRVTIASEFTKCPNMMLLDEPTTGLDSATSYSLISKLKCITTEAKTSTIISLLQPSPELVQLFDDVLILAEHGRIAYFGPMSDMLPYFESIQIRPYPDQPIAEFIQEVPYDPNRYLIENQINSKENISKSIDPNLEDKLDLYKLFKESKNNENIQRELDGLVPNGVRLMDHSIMGNQQKSSIWYETKLCLERHLKIMKIMKFQYLTRFFQAVFMGFVVGTLFYQMGTSQADARNRFGLLYFSMVLEIWTTVGSIEEFYTLRNIYFDQKDGKFYRTFPYFISLVVTKIPVSLIESLLFSLTCYWLSGLRHTADSYILFILGLAMTNLVSQGIFQTVSVFTENVLISSLVNPAVIVLAMIFSGYMLPKPKIPGWYIWIHYLTPLKYLLEMLCSSEMVHQEFNCAENELIPPKNYPTFNLTYPDGFNGVQICPQSSGNDFLEFFGMPQNSYFRWIDLVIAMAYALVLFSVFFVGLKYIRFETKKPAKQIKPKKNKDKKNEKSRSSKHHLNGCYMTFSDLGYTVESKRKNVSTGKNETVTLKLLQGINGYCTPGMMALMGASGAGKSTLLDVFSRRKNMGIISGDIRVNGEQIENINLTRFTGYVEQMDILPANMTVREAIEFSANCRLPSTVSFQDKQKSIDDILRVLSLTKLANTKIGPNPTIGISLANRKKVSIGIELASDPKLLFLDEPTSSLDSSDALKVMNCVKRIADSGRTIICTIHQPSQEIFEKFDQLLVLDKGQTIYFGETGTNSEKVLEYFTSQGYQYQPGRNPADFILEISEQHHNSGGASHFEPPIDHYKNSSINQEVINRLKNNYSSIVPNGSSIPKYKSQYSSSFSTQFYCLLRRCWLNYTRRPQVVLLRFLRSFIPSLVCGTMFLQLDNDQAGARNKISMTFLSFLFGGMASIGKIPLVVEDRAIYYRERSQGTYPPILYLLASFITDLPMMLMTAFCFWIPFFWLTGLDHGHDGWKFFFTLAVYTLVIICYDCLAMFFALTLPTVPIATLFSSMGLNFLGLFGGFFIGKNSIKKGWIWMYHLVFTKYGLETLGITVLKDQKFSCPDGVGAYDIPVGPNNETLSYCPIQTGEDMIAQFGFNVDRQFINVIILGCYIIGYLILCFLSLTFIKHMKR